MPPRDVRFAELDEAIERARRRKDWAAVVPSAQDALDHARRIYGEQHPFTGARWHILGQARFDDGDLASAEEALQKALSIRQSSLGDRHPACAATLRELSRLRARQGDVKGARPFLKKALQIREAALGRDHAFSRRFAATSSSSTSSKTIKSSGSRSFASTTRGWRTWPGRTLPRRSRRSKSCSLDCRRVGDFHPDVVSCLLSLAGGVPLLRCVRTRLAAADRGEAGPARNRLGGFGALCADPFAPCASSSKNG